MPKQNPFGKIGDSSPPESPAKKGNEPEPERTLLVKHDVCVYRIPPQVMICCEPERKDSCGKASCLCVYWIQPQIMLIVMMVLTIRITRRAQGE